jgi:hypothetical protein
LITGYQDIVIAEISVVPGTEYEGGKISSFTGEYLYLEEYHEIKKMQDIQA